MYINFMYTEFTAPFKEFPHNLKANYTHARTMCSKCGYGVSYIWVNIVLFVIFPIFLLSRTFSLFFPFVAIIYYGFDDIESIQLFQWLLTSIYFILIVCYIVACLNCIKFYIWTSHLFVGCLQSTWYGVQYCEEQQLHRLNLMQQVYYQRFDQVYIEKQRKKMVIEILGKDIGGLIVSYWPLFEWTQLIQQIPVGR